MAPFDSALPTKISPLIDGQVPDHIQADHPIFVEFLKQYYKFLESAQITIDGNIDQVLLETLTPSFVVLDATDISGSNGADKIVFESGSGTTGKFVVGETITGTTSKATAKILVDDNEQLFITANQRFIEGETITGGTSSATSTLKKYRANPVQNIQQLLEYASPDNTVDHFLSAFRNSFMESIPTSLASGVSKRNLIKQIRDMYAAKGTSEGHKLFFRVFLGQEAIITYPAKYMMRLSDGNWSNPLAIRCTSDSGGAIPNEMTGQIVTGASSGTSAQIISVSQFNQGTDSVVEFTLREDSITGSGFTASEVISGVSTSKDTTMQFTIQNIVLNVTTDNFGGILYSPGDSITLDPSIGNGKAEAKVSQTTTGSISDIVIDVTGQQYNVGDGIKFTNNTSDTSVNSARAFVSVTGGRLSTEDATSEVPEVIVQESGTVTSLVSDKILLNGTSLPSSITGEPYSVLGTDRRYSNTESYYYPLYLTEQRAGAKNLDTGKAEFFVFEQYPDTVFWAPSNLVQKSQDTYSDTLYNLFFTDTLSLDDGYSLRLESGNPATGMDNETDSNTESELGDLIISNEVSLTKDAYSTDTDGVILETETLGSNEAGEINRIYLIDGGSGYTKLPTATISTVNGQDAELVLLTKDIGAISEIEVTDSGFKYATEPGVVANTNLILKDVVGSFGVGNTLQTHTGSVVSYDSVSKTLTVDSTPTNRLTGETASTSNDGITLEDNDIVEPGRPDHGPVNQLYKVNDEFGSGFLIDGISEEGNGIELESFEVGEILTEALEVDVYQISMEIDDMDAPIDEGIELESGVFVSTDTSGKFLLNSHRLKAFRRSERFEDHVKLEDESAGTNIFGEQEQGSLLYDFSVDDVNDNISLEVATSGGTDLNNYNVMLETSTENEGDKLELDGSILSFEDKIEYQLDTSIVFGNNTDSILLENSVRDGDGSPSYLVNEDQGNAIVLNTTGGVDNLDNAGDKLLQSVFDVSEFSVHGQSIKHSNTPSGRLLGESLETFVTEYSPIKDSDVSVLDKGRLLYNLVISSGDEEYAYGNIIDEGGDKLLNEHSGQNLLLDSTDGSGTNAGSQLLMEDDSGTDQIILNQTASDGSNSGAEIVMEDAYDVVGDAILDSSGASAKIIAQGTAQGVASIGTTVNKPGGYINTDSVISEDIIRIQDSYFYQQFSYEVKVGAVLSDYINELKASVHPAGFIPFGKISLATQISAAIGTTAVGVIDYTGDDTFTPELASLFGVVFGETLQMTTAVREGVLDPTGGSSIFDTIIQENGVAIGDNLLEETDGDNLQFESGLDIAIENSQSSGDGSILLDAGAGSGRLLAETALGENGIAKRSLSHVSTIKVRPEIVVPKTGYGAPLASGILPGSIFFTPPSIQLEDGLRGKLPAIMEDNLVLDGTDKDSANAGFHISYETNLNEQSGIQIGDISNLSIADLVEIDTIGFTEPAGTLKTNEGGIVFEQSSAADEFVLETYLQFITEDGDFFDLETETDTGYLIGSGTGYAAHNINIVLDGQLNRGEKLLTEGSKIEFEDNTNKGSIPEGNFGNSNITQFTREARIGSDTSTNRLSLQDEYEIGLNFALENEVGNIILDGTTAVLDIEDNIILDGTDSGKSNAGDGLVLDTAADENDNLLLDSSGGRDLGDKLVMFDTVRNQVADNEGGFFLLDGTDSSSTNAGDELLLEIKNDGTGTLQFLKQNTINIANGLPSESGGLNLPVLESDTGDGSAVITTLDSTVGTFDSTQTTFDAA